jgi:peptide/nickel transport system permease protein
VPVILITDVLVWLLVAAAAGYAFYCRRHPHLAVPWARVFRSSAAMASAVVLAAFMAVGLLDSFHFRPALTQQSDGQAAYSSEVLSVLDLGLVQLRGRGEKTYSAPLATRSYAKEQVELPDGRQTRDFPRLQFGGAHLKDEGERAGDVARRGMLGLAAAAALSFLFFHLMKILRKKTPEVAWNAAYV